MPTNHQIFNSISFANQKIIQMSKPVPGAKKDPKDDMSGKVKVVCRFRPLNPFELSQGGALDIAIGTQGEVRLGENQHSFIYDHVFPIDSQQKDVYKIAAQPVVESVFEGFNGTIIAYGQTASGKTYTMEGKGRMDPSVRGIIPRMVDNIFDFIADSPETAEFMVKISVMEIYMEELRDLLNPENKNSMRIRSTPTKGVYVEGITEVYVSSPEEVHSYLKVGKKNRSVGRTNMNLVSSRSHLLLTLTLHQNNTKEEVAKTGKLLMVDLAGSEKASKTGAEGKTFQEAKQINQSLLYLGNVINALNEGKYVPYRNSQLTRLLEHSLGGNSKTTLIINCSPASYNEQETLSTLRFGARAQNILNKPTQNCEYTVEQLEKMLNTSKETNTALEKRISYLQGVIKDNVPNFILNFNEGSVEHKSETVYTSNTQDSSSDMSKKEIKSLRDELFNAKEKIKGLKFENSRLTLLLQQPSPSPSRSSTPPPTPFPESQKLLLNESLIESPQPQSTQSSSPDTMLLLFQKRLKGLSLTPSKQHSLLTPVRALHSLANTLLASLSSARERLGALTGSLRSHLAELYPTLSALHTRTAVPPAGSGGFSTPPTFIALLALYHSENKHLKNELTTLRDASIRRENEIIEERAQQREERIRDDARMRRLARVLRKVVNIGKLDKSSSNAIPTKQLDFGVEALPGENGGWNVDWDRFSEATCQNSALLDHNDKIDREDKEWYEVNRQDAQEGGWKRGEDQERGKKVIKKIKGGGNNSSKETSPIGAKWGNNEI